MHKYLSFLTEGNCRDSMHTYFKIINMEGFTGVGPKGIITYAYSNLNLSTKPHMICPRNGNSCNLRKWFLKPKINVFV